MKEIKSKPTEYKGIQFRSKLEAQVAYFFDQCGVPWQYEPDRLGDGDKEYNPDFYLPETDDYVEVKGERPGYEKEILKARSFVSFDGPIKRLIIISEIPDPNQPGMPHFPAYYLSTMKPYGDHIEIGWYFFQDIDEGKSAGHISSADYYAPRINKWNLDEKFKPFSINPVSDKKLSKHPKPIFDQDYTEQMWEADELAYDLCMKDSNKTVFTALAKARKADFTMRRVRP